MTNKTIFLSILFILSISSIFAESLISKIEKVTVYRQGAFISRTADAIISKGQSEIIIYAPFGFIDPESARIEPNGNFQILSIRHALDYMVKQAKSTELIALENEKEITDKKLKLIELENTLLQEELNFLNGEKLISKDHRALNVSELNNLMQFYRAQLNLIRKAMFEKSTELTLLKEKLDELNEEIRIASKREKVNQFIVQIFSEKEMSGGFELKYWTDNATWESIYDIRVKDIDRPLMIQSNASLVNNTGEDWDQIALTFSTGNPWRSTKSPKLIPTWLTFQDVRDFYNRAKYQHTQPDMVMESMNMRTLIDEDNGLTLAPPSSISENMTTMEFKILEKRTIKSNGQANIIELERNQIPVHFHYEAFPSKSQYAFLKATIKEWEKFNFSNGTASLYFQGTYIGKTMMNPETVADTMDISFGPDIAVIVSRKKNTDFEEKKWFGFKKVETKGYSFEVKNNKSKSIEIKIMDQMPISTNEDIEVETVYKEGAQLDEETGILNWRYSIDSGKSIGNKFAYKITSPKGKDLASRG